MERKNKIKKLKHDMFKKALKIFLKKKFYARDFILFSKYNYISSLYSKTTFFVHNGLSFRRLKVSPFIYCNKFSFFVFCKKPFKYLLKKKKR